MCKNLKPLKYALQHAPYDAMVLVSMCWYLDQQIKATEGKWKVLTLPGLNKLKQFLSLVFHFNYLCPLFTVHIDTFKGSNTVRSMPPPKELVFTVDEKVRADISHAKQQYIKSVSLY